MSIKTAETAKPFGYDCEYHNFDACVRDQRASGHTVEEAGAICATIMRDTEAR